MTDDERLREKVRRIDAFDLTIQGIRILRTERDEALKHAEAMAGALGSVAKYHRGEGGYNLSHLPSDERANEAFDAWQRVFAEVCQTLTAYQTWKDSRDEQGRTQAQAG